jgi:hypothetical protein
MSPHVTHMHKDNFTVNDILKYLKQSLTKIMTAIFLALNLNSHDHASMYKSTMKFRRFHTTMAACRGLKIFYFSL